MDLYDTLEALRLAMARRNPRIQENFADFDRLRSGNVTKEQFRRCLATSTLTDGIDETSVRNLIENYTSPTNPILASYTRFLADLKAGEPPREQLSPTRGTVKQLTEEEEATLQRSYSYFKQRIAATNLDLRVLFKDFDKYNNGTVTAAQFERCFPFRVDPAVLAAIKKKYPAASGNGDISYLCWCSDVLGQPLGDGTIRFRTSSGSGRPTSSVGRDAAFLADQIRVQLATNRLRCDDFLRDYDKLNTGVVTAAQFAAALGRVHFVRFQLTEADLRTLAEYYSTEDKSGQKKVNYSAFLADVAPHIQPSGLQSLNQTFGLSQGSEEEKRCDAVLDRIRNLIATQRMNLRPTFHDFDQAKNGLYRTRTCTRSRFERALGINNINLSPAEVALLCKRYATTSSNAGDDINYSAFCDDVDQPTESSESDKAALRSITSQPSSPAKVGSSSSSSSLPPASPPPITEEDMGRILDTIMRAIIARRVRLSEFIRDNDPLRTGSIPRERFLSAILTSNVVLTAAELEALANYYAHPTVAGYVDSSRFLKDIDTGARIVHPAQDPADREVDVKQRTLASYADKKSATIAANGPQLTLILRRIAEEVRARGVLLPPFFKDYDLHKCGRITKSQFHQTLSRHRFPVTEADVELLKKYYEDPTDKTMVKYREFFGDIDESENVAAQLELRQSVRKLPNVFGSSTAGATRSFGSSGSGSGSVPSSPSRFEGSYNANNTTADAVLQKIADYVLRRNVRLEEFFKDGDALRKGFVSNGRFRHAIDILGVALSDAEMQCVEAAFASTKAPESVDYVDFLAAVKDTKAEAQVLSMNATRAAAAAKRTELEDQLLEHIIEKVKRAFGSRRVASRQVFQDYDKLHKGRVPEGHFFTALLSVGLNLTPLENQALKKAFSQGDGSMAYGEFSARVDAQLGLNE